MHLHVAVVCEPQIELPVGVVSAIVGMVLCLDNWIAVTRTESFSLIPWTQIGRLRFKMFVEFENDMDNL